MLIVKLKKNILTDNYSIILTKKQKKHHVADKVLEKLGTYNVINGRIHINIFRLVYWFSKNAYCTGNVWTLLSKFYILND